MTADKTLTAFPLYLVGAGGDVTARAHLIFGAMGKDDQKMKDDTGTLSRIWKTARSPIICNPETVDLLMKLGSKNSNNCPASTCVVKAAP